MKERIINSFHDYYIVTIFFLLTFTETFPDTSSKEPFSYVARIPFVRFSLKETSLTLLFRGTLRTKRTKTPGGIMVTELETVAGKLEASVISMLESLTVEVTFGSLNDDEIDEVTTIVAKDEVKEI